MCVQHRGAARSTFSVFHLQLAESLDLEPEDQEGGRAGCVWGVVTL